MKENRALKIADTLFWMYYVASSLFYDHEDSCTRVSCKQMSWFAWVGLMPIFALLFHFVVPYSKTSYCHWVSHWAVAQTLFGLKLKNSTSKEAEEFYGEKKSHQKR